MRALLTSSLLFAVRPRAPLRCQIPISMAATDPPPADVPKFIMSANAATKWLVVAAQTSAVVVRRDVIAPYIVVGSIGSAFVCKKLKKAFNQQRPAGAPFTDPGMPSSHALVATFAAAAWALHQRQYAATAAAAALWPPLLLAGAAIVALLRVATGYHTWAQIGVGSGLGVVGATAWMGAGHALLARRALSPLAVWAAYLGGSFIFITKAMAKWSWRS